MEFEQNYDNDYYDPARFNDRDYDGGIDYSNREETGITATNLSWKVQSNSMFEDMRQNNEYDYDERDQDEGYENGERGQNHNYNPSEKRNNTDWDRINDGIAGYGLAKGVKTSLIEEAGKLSALTKTTSNYLKLFKGAGYVAAGINTTYTAINAGSYYSNGGTEWQVGAKAALDVTMTAVSFMGPVGFGLSMTYFLLDTAGAFGEFGQITP